MSGHSKWATTKHKKAIIDARRGKNFAKLIKNVEVAARVGGGDPGGNPTLYDAIQKAKKNSVPNDNIERARKRGAGEEAGGADWQTITYEGYGPNGVAVLIECLTDNRNRAAGEVRVAIPDLPDDRHRRAERGAEAEHLREAAGCELVDAGSERHEPEEHLHEPVGAFEDERRQEERCRSLNQPPRHVNFEDAEGMKHGFGSHDRQEDAAASDRERVDLLLERVQLADAILQPRRPGHDM